MAKHNLQMHLHKPALSLFHTNTHTHTHTHTHCHHVMHLVNVSRLNPRFDILDPGQTAQIKHWSEVIINVLKSMRFRSKSSSGAV